MKKANSSMCANMIRFMMAGMLLYLIAITTFTAHGAPLRSKGVPSGWIEDFNAAKIAAAKENKHILMCSIASDTHWGKKMYNEVYSQGKFSGKLKKQFVLMMVDMARDSKNLSKVALVQNLDLRNRYSIWGSGNCCVVDKDGNSLKHFNIEGDALACWIRVESVTRDIPPPLPVKQTAVGARTGNAPRVVQPPPTIRPPTATPAPTPVRSMTPSAHLREGNRLASVGEWSEALMHFKQSGGRLAKIAEYEAGSKASSVKLADAWWKAMSLAPDAKTRLAYQSHAAHLYRTALAEGGLSKDAAGTAAQRGAEKGNSLYCVIDLSGGVNAASYPVSYLDDVPEVGWSEVYKTRKIVLRRIEPGTFIMGENQSDESRRVTITRPFYMGVFEVTQKQYELVTGNNPSKFQGAMRPVGNLSFNDIRGDAKVHNWPNVHTVDANSFVGRIRARTGLNIDLPPETEWEYACRAGTTSKFNNGGNGEDDWIKVGRVPPNQSELGWLEPKKFQYDHKPDGKGGYDSYCTVVGMYLPNAWGLYDMHGNLWEWTLEWAPLGSRDGTKKVAKGGCFDSPLFHCTSSSFRRHAPHDKWRQGGFRLFISATGESEGHRSQQKRHTDSVSVVSSQLDVPAVSKPTVPDVAKGQYCVIDLSRGASASSYPVSYLNAMPGNGWSDEFKTSKMVLRRLPAGSFVMGPNQKDTSRLTSIEKPYYIGVFEVTQKQWELVTGGNPAVMKGAMRPVENVSMDTVCGGTEINAASFLGRLRSRTKLAFDLPTEAQWEFACRAGTTSAFNNGCDSEYEEMWQLGRFYLNQGKTLKMLVQADPSCHQRPDGRGGCKEGHTEVGSYMPNDWSLYDMHGNVAEMCHGRNGWCVVRGGAWSDSTYRQGHCRLVSSARVDQSSDTHHVSLGLRLVFVVP